MNVWYQFPPPVTLLISYISISVKGEQNNALLGHFTAHADKEKHLEKNRANRCEKQLKRRLQKLLFQTHSNKLLVDCKLECLLTDIKIATTIKENGKQCSETGKTIKK